VSLLLRQYEPTAKADVTHIRQYELTCIPVLDEKLYAKADVTHIRQYERTCIPVCVSLLLRQYEPTTKAV
jgi:hypothetical protein